MTTPGIFIHGLISLTPGGASFTEGELEVIYTPVGSLTAIVARAELDAFEVDDDVYYFELRIPSEEQFPGYPIDPSEALSVPFVPTDYTRSFTLDGQPLIVEDSSIG